MADPAALATAQLVEAIRALQSQWRRASHALDWDPPDGITPVELAWWKALAREYRQRAMTSE